MEGMWNTLKPPLVKCCLLISLLWLLTCCNGTVSKNYRVMWVSTTGEDSPQCIHDTPAGSQVFHPLHHYESCSSLNYAFKHIRNHDTLIVIDCGIHVLEPVDSLLDGTPLLKNFTAIAIVGACKTRLPQIHCTDGANLAFYNVGKVVNRDLAFQYCGKQLHHSNSLSEPSTLYLQDCNTIIMEHVLIVISGPYGRGISLIRYDATITHGDVLMERVKIHHFGIHGSGIHLEILTGGTRDVSMAREQIQLKNLLVNNKNAHTRNHTMTFTAINITVMGYGEGGEIIITDVRVNTDRSGWGNGISIALHNAVCHYNVTLQGTEIVQECQNLHDQSSRKNEQSLNSITNATNNSTTHSSINVELRGNATGNLIQVGHVLVLELECKESPVRAFSIEVTDQSVENAVLLQEIELVGSNSSEGYSRGLQLIIAGWARRNKIEVTELASSWFHMAHWGAGGYIEFSEHATENSVNIQGATFVHNHAVRGGGIAVIYKDMAIKNRFKIHDIYVYSCFAELGGGVYLILQDSSNNNYNQFTTMNLYSNTAHSGGGILIKIQDTSVANIVVIHGSHIRYNELLLSQKHDIMGGGIHVEFSTVSATFRTDNRVNITKVEFRKNAAEQGVGGGFSVLYKHSHYQGNNGDSVTLNFVVLLHNLAASGSACAFQSLPTHGKRLFRGIRVTNIIAFLLVSHLINHKVPEEPLRYLFPDYHDWYLNSLSLQSLAVLEDQLAQGINPSFQVETNTNMIFAKSVQITVRNALKINCGASSQGINALNSEIVFQADTWSGLRYCVATHGGAIALYGESYIRVTRNVTVEFNENHAFQRGGAIYVSSAPDVVPVANCFLQYDQEWEESSSVFLFIDNTAKAEGQSVYVSDARNCFNQTTKNTFTTKVAPFPNMLSFSIFDILQFNFLFLYIKVNSTYDNEAWTALQWEIGSGPKLVKSATFIKLNKQSNIEFIPGKQKKLPYTHACDEFGNNLSSVFTVLINKMDGSLPVELNSFSKQTADFTVILHGIPQRHGMANHSFPSNTGYTSAVVRPPQLVLQSVDNTDLLLVMNIELQCCPPGYVFRYGSGDMGSCICGIRSLIGMAKCNESHPEVIGAVLERDHWAGYLPSNDQHSCDGQKFFTGLCPPGYCQMQPSKLPENNSQQELQNVVCTGYDRKGILCGDCLESKGIAVNFNGIRPVCVSCEEGLSKVGIIVWILCEWVPMLAFMFVLMLFNIDLVSGRFNSFLLFAQLLAFSTIRGDAELGPVHNAFVRIYRFLYGMWNLDFFGVLLPPHCLTPHAHLTLLQTILLHYSIGLFPLTVAITLIVLERSAEKWICCHRVDQCLRRMRRWKAKYSDGMSYDRALPAFVILGFTRFLVSSSYILVNQTITGEDGERKVVVWWQGSVLYGSIQHIAYFIPAIVILLVFVLLPSFLLLTLPIGPQLFGRLLIAVPPLRKLQRIQTFCSNVYTDRWVYHFVNVFQSCYKERFRSFSSLYLFHRIVHLLVAVFIPSTKDALCIQIFLTVALLLLIATFQPYNSRKLNTLDTAILGNMALILILSLHITDLNIPIGTRQFFASLQMILIYLPLLYPGILLGKKVYLKCRQLRCCQKQEEQREDNAEPLLEAPAERLGNLVLITELRAGVPTSEDDDTVTETETETVTS